MQTSELSLFGHTARSILASDTNRPIPRDLDSLELFAGVGSIFRAVWDDGFTAHAYDCDNKHLQQFPQSAVTVADFCTQTGFEKAMGLVLRLREEALFTAAPICSSFVFPNSAGHARKASNDYEGDKSKQYVLDGDTVAMGTIILFDVAIHRNIDPLLENPPRSFLWKYSPVKEFLEREGFEHILVVNHCAFDNTRPVGERFFKEFQFVGRSKWHLWVDGRCKCGDSAEHVRMMESFVQQETGRAKDVGKTRSTGKKSALKDSQAYPLLLGIALADAWGRRALPDYADPEGPIPEALSRPVLKRPAGFVGRQAKRTVQPSWLTPADSNEEKCGSERSAGSEEDFHQGNQSPIVVGSDSDAAAPSGSAAPAFASWMNPCADD